jgi:hypothetical protein
MMLSLLARSPSVATAIDPLELFEMAHAMAVNALDQEDQEGKGYPFMIKGASSFRSNLLEGWVGVCLAVSTSLSGLDRQWTDLLLLNGLEDD